MGGVTIEPTAFSHGLPWPEYQEYDFFLCLLECRRRAAKGQRRAALVLFLFHWVGMHFFFFFFNNGVASAWALLIAPVCSSRISGLSLSLLSPSPNQSLLACNSLDTATPSVLKGSHLVTFSVQFSSLSFLFPSFSLPLSLPPSFPS